MNNLAKVENNSPVVSQGQDIMPIIDKLATNPNVDVDKLERLLNMQERIVQRSAMEQFNAAMADMQCEIPDITERTSGHNHKYASLEDINAVVKPIMQNHGFSISFKVKNASGYIEVTGVLMHRGGHREETSMILPYDTGAGKNAVQAVGSSTSYGKRYVMCSLLNITTRGEDDDGESSAPTKLVTAFQAVQISKLVERNSDKVKEHFANRYGDASNVPRAEFDDLTARLLATAKKHEQEVMNASSTD